MTSKKVGISLGGDCLPAHWGVHYGYRDSKQQGYKTCPFDLMLSNYEGVIKCINEDFDHFTDPDYLTIQHDCIVNTYYKFGFNHETPGHADLYKTENWQEGTNHFINNNFAHFIERYDQRISNFKKYLENEENFITFIIHATESYNYTNDDCVALKTILKIKYPKLNYKIIIIDGPIPHNVLETKILKSL